MTYGNGLIELSAYNNRLQPTQLRTYNPTTSTDVLNLNYGFTNSAGANNGNVVTFNSTATQIFLRTYTYDELNRLSTMSSPADASGCYGLSWTYDAWGNRLSQTPTSGSCLSPSHAVWTNNRIIDTGYSHDAAGNMTNDATHAYTFNAESQLTQVDSGSTASYVYDAGGQRARKIASGVTTDYVRDASGNVVAEIQGSIWTKGYAYSGSQLLAQYNGVPGASGATTLFSHSDHLGSTRALTTIAAGISDSMDYLPYGELISGGSSTTHKFTGKERDTESGLDDFEARYFGSNMGRFMSPDDFTKDSHVDDPQSWNKYTYARNNPLRYVDPTGQEATVSTSCSTTNNQTTCNVNISASIAIYASPGSDISQDQLNSAASTIQSSIQNAWSGSFTQDGVTYNVTTQVSVEVEQSAQAASDSGAQNVIALTNGPPTPDAGAYVNPRSLAGAITGRGPDTGVWDINHLDNYAKHEFTHLLGTDDKQGAVLSNTDPAMRPDHATAQDLKWGIREAVQAVNSMVNGPWRIGIRGEPVAPPTQFSTTNTVRAGWRWWK